MNTAGLFNSDAAAIYVLLVVIAVIVFEVAWTVLCLEMKAEQFHADKPKRIQRHLDTLGDAGKTLAQRLFLIYNIINKSPAIL